MSRNRKRLSTLGAVMLVVIIVMPVLTPGAWAQSKYKTLYKFSGGKDGKYPQAVLIFDQAGNLYGTTPEGGDQGLGTVFKLAPNADGSWRESVLYSFCSRTNCGDGAQPAAGLVFDQAGNLYGTTLSRGANDRGTVFKLAPNADGSWRESVLHSFCSRTNCGDGEFPLTSLIFDQAGNLYGTTQLGGAHGLGGTVFKLAPNADGSWRESVLHSFCSRTNCGDGKLPLASLIFDQAGNLYSTTAYEGDPSCNSGYGCGVVFKLVPNSNGGWKETVLHTFFDHPGAIPLAGVIFDPAGNLYGTSSGDGSTTFGSVFEITP
jgi:uncharacterized repeat protein (TIGR03803 family)